VVLVGVAVAIVESVSESDLIVCELVEAASVLEDMLEVVAARVCEVIGVDVVDIDIDVVVVEATLVELGCVTGSPIYCRPRSLILPDGSIKAVSCF
jgi:hypothetical protein